MVEKGEYKNGLLDGYGSRVFKNNNFYEGYFSLNLFQGEGVLEDSEKGNWIYGLFQKG